MKMKREVILDTRIQSVTRERKNENAMIYVISWSSDMNKKIERKLEVE